MIDAGRAGWGSLLGNIGAMLAKLIIALAMIMIFLISGSLTVLSHGNCCVDDSLPAFLLS